MDTKKTTKHTIIRVQLPEPLKNTLVKLAKKNETSQSEVMRNALRIFDLVVTTAEATKAQQKLNAQTPHPLYAPDLVM